MSAKRPDKEVADEFEAVRLSDVPPEEVRYLVEPYLPLGALCLLEGDPAAGKSYVAADLGAALTRGREPFLGLHEPKTLGAPRNVLYVTAEETPHALRDRFAAQGADLERVFCVTRAISARNLEPLVRLLDKHKPGLVVIDPLQALLDRVNMSSANAVRVALAPLVSLAGERRCSVLMVRHLAKAGSGRAIYRGIGSIDFSAIARAVLRIGEDPARPGYRVLVHVKNSHGALGLSVEFEIGERLVWLGKSELTARDLDAMPPRTRGRSALEIAEEFLRDELKQGPRRAMDVRTAAANVGIAERTLERAQKNLAIAHERGNTGGEPRGKGRWIWRLP